MRRAPSWPFGQVAGSDDSAIGRRISKTEPHSPHR